MQTVSQGKLILEVLNNQLQQLESCPLSTPKNERESRKKIIY